MRLLIAGAQGQLGRELARLGVDQHPLLAVGHRELDITDVEAVNNCIARFHPDVVINAAAYTNVDKAESESEIAFAVNRDGPLCLAQACQGEGIPLIHISTDYVFDGTKQGAYVEGDPINPLNRYGASKLAGEQMVQQYCEKQIVLRTSWVFSVHGSNFVKTMLRLGSEREELNVVADQFGKPTSAAALARMILDILPVMDGKWGLYHVAQPDAVSWHGFAEAIFIEARRQGMRFAVSNIGAIMAKDYPTAAKRPENAILACGKFEGMFDESICCWRKSLADVIASCRNGMIFKG